MANAQLSQSIRWSGPTGAFYDILVNPAGGGTALKIHPAGQATSIVLGTLLTGVDLNVNPIVDIHVQTKLNAAGDLPSGWSQPALQLTIVGFGVPAPPTLVP